ncbi:MAG TPA: type II toxin-antitoxin system antitoxin SocA domain-containing protein [Longimicrobium sp.]|nr:type II toxin-antitoxin system antitoxin SocA domain-containing protein [Longimicrobium sp.]
MQTPLDFANWFLARVDRRAGDSITHLKLQKLLFYAQAWALVLLGEPIFDEDFQAWQHGPVLRSVYDRFQGSGYQALSTPRRGAQSTFDPQVEELLEDILRLYGEHSAKALEDQTHREDPWVNARGGRPANAACRTPISKESMKNFFGAMFLEHGGPVIAPTPQGFRVTGTPFLDAGGNPLPPPADDGFPPPDHDDFDRALSYGLSAVGRKRARKRQQRPE